MANNIGDLVATATLDIAPFITNTKNLKTHLRGLDASLKAVETGIKGQGNKMTALRTVYTETSGALKGYQGLLDKQTAHYNNLKREIGDTSTATEKQKETLLGARTTMLDTAAKVGELQKKLRKLATEMSVFTQVGRNLKDAGTKIQSFGNSMAGVGKSLTMGLTAPLLAGAGYAVKAAVDYESAFAGVKKTVDEVVDKNGVVTYSYERLSDGIRKMAKELPASAAEIAGVAEVAGQLGIKTEDVLNFTRVMIDMGESTNLSANDAATAIAKIANITGLTSDEYQRFGSSVVALGKSYCPVAKKLAA